MRAARGAAAVAGAREQLAGAGILGGAAVAAHETAAELRARGGAAGLAGLVEELMGAFGIGRHSPAVNVEEGELEAPLGAAGLAAFLMKRQGVSQLHRFLAKLPSSPHRELDLLAGALVEEDAIQRARAVHGRGVEGEEPVAVAEAGPRGGTALRDGLEDHSGLRILRIAQAGAERRRACRTGVVHAAEEQQKAQEDQRTR